MYVIRNIPSCSSAAVHNSTMPVIDVFYELKLTTVDSSLTIYPKRCYATPTIDPLHKIQYDLIKDGYVLDSHSLFIFHDHMSYDLDFMRKNVLLRQI